MRYWQHGETGRLLKIDVQMSTYTWVEITKEQYEDADKSSKGIEPNTNVLEATPADEA
jgi:hypothetical protein